MMLCDPVIHPEIFGRITAVNIIRVCLYPTLHGMAIISNEEETLCRA